MKQELKDIKIGQPAHRALQTKGIANMEQLSQHTEKELLGLHGFGPKALEILREALKENGFSFKSE